MLKHLLTGSIVFLCFSCLNGMQESQYKFEGLLGSPVTDINNMNTYVPAFVPYNPIIVEIGAYQGLGTLKLATMFPYGKIYALEANPSSYEILKEKMKETNNTKVFNLAISSFNGKAKLWGDGAQASLICRNKGLSCIPARCMVLDDWCARQGIEHIDFLRLDAGGLEWQILHRSPKILNTVLIIVTRTHMAPSKNSIPSFTLFKKLLESKGFELLAHWYQEGGEGEATFVRKNLYDSLFR